MPKPTAPHVFAVHARNVEDALAVYQGLLPGLHVRGQADKFQLDLAGVDLGGLLCLESGMSWGGGLQTAAQRDCYVLTHYLQGGVRYQGVTGHDWRASAGEFQMVDGCEVSSAWRLPGTRLQSVWVNGTDLHKHLSAVTGCEPGRRVRFVQRLSGHHPGARAAMALAGMLMCDSAARPSLLSSPLALTSLRETLLNTLCRSLPHSHAEPVAPGQQFAALPRSIRRAMDFMHAHAHEAIGIADIAAAACCSVRSLQAGFRHHRCCTPMAYLRQIRLEAVRNDLLTAPRDVQVSVGETAYRWGFFHLGLFAKRYLELFGERPSDTLRRRAQ